VSSRPTEFPRLLTLENCLSAAAGADLSICMKGFET
jgi:hypothetical protein